LVAQLVDALQRHFHLPLALKSEGFRYDGNGQDAPFAGDLGDDRRRPRPCPSTHPRSQKDHLRPFQQTGDLLTVFLGGLTPDLRVATSPPSVRQAGANLQPLVGFGEGKGLGVSVNGDQLHACHAIFHHPIDGVAPCTPDADDPNVHRLGRPILAMVVRNPTPPFVHHAPSPPLHARLATFRVFFRPTDALSFRPSPYCAAAKGDCQRSSRVFGKAWDGFVHPFAFAEKMTPLSNPLSERRLAVPLLGAPFETASFQRPLPQTFFGFG